VGIPSLIWLDGTVDLAGAIVKNACAHFHVPQGAETARHHREQVGHFPLVVASCLASRVTQYRT